MGRAKEVLRGTSFSGCSRKPHLPELCKMRFRPRVPWGVGVEEVEATDSTAAPSGQMAEGGRTPPLCASSASCQTGGAAKDPLKSWRCYQPEELGFRAFSRRAEDGRSLGDSRLPKTPTGVRKVGVSLRSQDPREDSGLLCLGDFHQLPTRRQPPWGAQGQLLAPAEA